MKFVQSFLLFCLTNQCWPPPLYTFHSQYEALTYQTLQSSLLEILCRTLNNLSIWYIHMQIMIFVRNSILEQLCLQSFLIFFLFLFFACYPLCLFSLLIQFFDRYWHTTMFDYYYHFYLVFTSKAYTHTLSGNDDHRNQIWKIERGNYLKCCWNVTECNAQTIWNENGFSMVKNSGKMPTFIYCWRGKSILGLLFSPTPRKTFQLLF